MLLLSNSNSPFLHTPYMMRVRELVFYIYQIRDILSWKNGCFHIRIEIFLFSIYA